MSGRLTIRNKSRYDTAEVRALVKFAVAEVDMRGVCVNVHPRQKEGWAGYAYEGVPAISNANASAEYLVTLRVGPPEGFPYTPTNLRRGEPAWTCNDWREAFVHLAAHEAKHIDQYKFDRPRSEVECNVFAEYMLRRYRKETA